MNPYEVLGVRKNATLKTIKAAWRKLAKLHPDNLEGGDRQKFEEAKLAFDILSNPERRSRYDSTGRTDANPITPERVKQYLVELMKTVISAQKFNGETDDPVWHNIKDKIILSIIASRGLLKTQRFEMQRKLERCQRMIERFKPKQEDDPIGDILKAEKALIEQELNFNDDAMQLSIAGENVFKEYDYDVGPGPEGHCSPGPTGRLLLGGSFISSPLR